MSKQPMMRTDEAMVQLLDKMLQEMRRLSDQSNKTLQLVQQQIPEGIVEPLEVDATTENKVVYPSMNKKWFSISVINDGPNTCSVILNTELSNTTSHELDSGGTFEADFGAPVIKDLLAYCTTGTAHLRIRGIR